MSCLPSIINSPLLLSFKGRQKPSSKRHRLHWNRAKKRTTTKSSEFHVQRTRRTSKRRIVHRHLHGTLIRMRTKKKRRPCFRISVKRMKFCQMLSLGPNTTVVRKSLKTKAGVEEEEDSMDSPNRCSDSTSSKEVVEDVSTTSTLARTFQRY